MSRFAAGPIKIRQGASLAKGTVIDGYLEQSEIDTLYMRWRSAWPTPLEYPGGVLAITCEMVLEVPESELIQALGKKLGTRILEVSRVNAGR